MFSVEELEELAAADAEIEANFDGLTAEERQSSAALDNAARAMSGSRKRNLDREQAYYQANRTRLLAYGRAYYQANRDKVRAAQRKRYQERKRRTQNAKNSFGRTGPGRSPNTVAE